MRPVRSFLILLFFSSSVVSFSQSAKTNTLLWRISGNALARPSYLFGTMHVTDKSAFHFQDSLYHFLETADAFAMEVHPDSLILMLTDYVAQMAEDKDWEKTLTKSQLKELDEKLARASQKLPVGSKSRKIKFLLDKMMNADKQEVDGMNTFMDAYLYEIARRNTKEIYGLEQLKDQVEGLTALRSGLHINNFFKELEKWDPATESPIHQFYYKEDIDRMESFYRTIFTDSVMHLFMYNRNRVMVQKMDSLMQGKSLFTAVGAGHLAGTKGVIALLRQKGYQVDPVFSANRIKAADYQLKAASLSWPVQQNSRHGFTYSMPGAPKIQDGQNGNEVALHFDIGNGLTYMVVSGVKTVEDKANELAAARKHLDQLMLSTSATLVSLDTVLLNNKPTLEALCKAKDNSHFRFREMAAGHMFYVFTLSGRNKEALYSSSANQYFASFKPLPTATSTWTKNNFSEAGFEVALPVPVKVEDTKLDADAAGKIAWKTYGAFDYRTAVNYTMYSCKALAGSELLDGYFFEHFINNIQENTAGGEVKVTDTLIGGFPAKHFVIAPYNGIVVKGLIVERLNHCYYLSAEYSHAAAEKEVDRFLASFALQPFALADWQTTTGPENNFSVWAPGPVQLSQAAAAAVDDETIFYTYDSGNAENFLISRKHLSKYLWADNKDSVYNYWISSNVDIQTDSILFNQAVTNGGMATREMVLKNKKSGIASKVRFVLDGNDMYKLAAVIPPLFADTVNINRFLQSFTIHYPQKETPVLANDPRLVFMDLQLENDAYFTNAYKAIDYLPFSTKELPLLMQQSLQAFPVTADGYESVNVKLLYKLQEVMYKLPGGKDSVLQWVKDHYLQLDSAVRHMQYSMLNIVAGDERPQSYALLKELLLQKPADGYYYSFFYTLNTSLRQAATLFPLLYQYTGDSTVGAAIVNLANHLLDSGYLTKESVREQKSRWVQLLNGHLKTTLKKEEAAAVVYTLLELAAKLNLPELNALATKYVAAKDKWIKLEAIHVLLKSGLPVPALVLQTLTADKYFRAGLYKKLKETKKVSLFPAAYRSQKSMAESYIYRALKDEDELEGEPEFIYIKTIETIYKGQKRRFFLFRLNMAESEAGDYENASSYFSVAGPFPLDATQIYIDDKDNVSGIYYESKFEGMQLNVLFKKYMQPFIKNRME